MSDDEAMIARWSIEPDPTADELVALFSVLPRPEPKRESSEVPASRWSEAARREQLRAMLDDTRNGWSR